ncbi:MAG: hypothetical protein K0S09_1902 [Sphingobacteriaceae bacterium]|jgi:hypothetical protein|nr:hypothetical protein [Sphingobacteriaceae bacterium]
MAEVLITISKLPSVQARRYSYTDNTKNALKPKVQLEFVCLFGTVTVILKKGVYLLEIDADLSSEYLLSRKDYLNLLRTAFKFTMFENTSENIEDLLTIVCSDTEHLQYYYKKKVSEPDTDYSFTAVQMQFPGAIARVE